MKILIRSLCVTLALSTPVLAQDDTPFVTFKVLKPALALQMATVAMQSCRDAGYQVGVTVVDRSGIPQAFVRDQFAGLHVYETSRRKAWTAVAFRTSTSDLAASTAAGQTSSGIRHLTEALPLGGGVVVYEGGGSIVAGIGVSGAPGPALDEACAAAGIAAIEDQIAF
ncbi:MAG: hypothetical protein ACI8R4_000397 [Paracoccaceae bacterium]|jgi:uncharacterized protein GlcG (DUF336 family)